MIRATTPTHVFTLPDTLTTEDMTEILVTYSQCDHKIVEKTKKDLELSANQFSVKLTQQEMNKFQAGLALIQVRAKNQEDEVMASQIFKVKVRPVLNQEVL